MPVFIGIAANSDTNKFGSPITSIPHAYPNCVDRAGAVPLILPVETDKNTIEQMLQRIDGLIIPGGLDMAPELFGQAPHPSIKQSDRDLDTFQMALVEAAVRIKMPILGICRGAQVINVALGGTLYQDVPSMFPDSSLRHMQEVLSFDTDHEVSFTPGSRLFDLFGPCIRINSRHHQSIDQAGKGLRITATAPDGVIEGAEHESLPIDLIQWHPELLMQKNDDMLPLFSQFVRNCQEL